MIQLFKHNQEAYERVMGLLSRVGKAAVIHPTGSGKSFIGFRLCEVCQEQGKSVCWLAPSEYIYRTQIENLARAGCVVPSNVQFYTYAKLAFLGDEELQRIQADYIILDEFHRCGAQVWGQGVKRLLASHSSAGLVGLSATHIRYLDNQRNMADELFDGNVASEMTLGEAIVRGILPEPKYVTSMYSYGDELGRYERQVRGIKNDYVRNEAEQVLEALRRRLEMAEGLDAIFAKHMKKDGKYIVFCANKEHLDEMVTKTGQWFAKVDTSPHIYTMYSDDAETNRNFQAFKGDESSHLKLLFVIDILNEGVHAEGVNGVVLLRPTVSPIIYKQQIGRALSTAFAEKPLIFDIVNNFENLYSVGALANEMKDAVHYLRDHEQMDEIVTEEFQIYEDIKECRVLFARLNESLTISWEVMYGCAKAYHRDHGHLHIPARFKTSEGYSLGVWLRNQRYIRRGDVYGSLGEEQIQKLDGIGMCWENAHEASWNKSYELVKDYYEEHGVGSIPKAHSPGGINLNDWVASQRALYKCGEMAEWKVEKLKTIGFVWEPSEENWGNRYEELLAFVEMNGSLPSSSDDASLYAWIRTQKKLKQNNQMLSQRVEMLENLGVNFYTTHSDKQWAIQAKALEIYIQEHGTLPPKNHKVGAWIGKELKKEREGKLLEHRKKHLQEIGVVFGSRKDRSLVENIQMLQAFVKENNRYPSTYDKYKEFSIGAWCTRIRKEYDNGKLEESHKKLLQEAGFDFRSSKEIREEEQWQIQSKQLNIFVHANGRLPKFRENQRLVLWYREQQEKVNAGDVEKARYVREIEEMLG